MEEFGAGFVLLGVPAMVAVPLIVEGLKRLGLPSRYAIVASVLVAGLVAGAAEALDAWPALTPLVRVVFGALLLGFSAAGVYSQARYQFGQAGRAVPAERKEEDRGE
ncbi:MAG TPA: hypothetical protein VFW96_17600 [Thermomicrobiales bacterium]|nr:hypothetical protein [Thermomicrobiales bacterium]